LIINVVLHFIFPVTNSGKIAEKISTDFEESKIIQYNRFRAQTAPLFFSKSQEKISKIEIIRRIYPLRLMVDKKPPMSQRKKSETQRWREAAK